MEGPWTGNSGSTARLVRTLIVAATLLIPVVVIVFALRSGGETSDTEAGPSTTAPQPSTTESTTTSSTTTTSSSTPSSTSDAAQTTENTETTGPEPETTEAQTSEVVDPDDTGSDTTLATENTVGTVVARRTTLLAEAPGDSSGVELVEGASLSMTGGVATERGGTWFEAISDSDVGWVLRADVAIATTGFDRRECGELPAESTTTPLAYRPGTADGSADGVVAIETHTSAECTRTVLLLADEGGPELASAFPPDIAVVDFGGHVRIDLDDPVHAPELGFDLLTDDGVVLTAFSADGPRLIIDRGPSAVSVSFLAEPARVVIDSAPVDDVRPGIGGGVVMSSRSIADARRAGPDDVVLVTGWARLTNGLGEIAFRRAPGEGDEPGSGLGVPIVFSGTGAYGTVDRSWYFYRTDRDGAVWSPFRFQISNLSPGAYEMFLGLGGDGNVPEDVDSPGLFQIIEVAP